MQDVIIGAAIGLISSLIVIVVTNIFQLKRDNKAREWLLEDQKNQRKREIFLQRTKDAEAYVDLMYNASHKYYTAVSTALLVGHMDKNGLDTITHSNQALSGATEKQIYIFYLNDLVLDKNMSDLFASFEVLRGKGTEVLANLQDPRYDKALAKKSLVEVLSTIGHLKKAMIRRLDELASLY